MTLQQLKYIVTVAERGSVSEAAKALFISQPSLSKAIREIEDCVHKTLFLRTPRGMVLTDDGQEFLGYARQVLQQMDMLEEKYSRETSVQHFSVSTHHYTFAANAFVELVKKVGGDAYEFTLFEGRTHEILQNVKNMRSEIGIIYLSSFNEEVIRKFLREGGLSFTPLFTVEPHAFLSREHPLSGRSQIALSDLDPYPCITFDQGIGNSFYTAEEVFSTRPMQKHIIVTDRAALVNFLIGLNAYTISTGIFPAYLHGTDIISVPIRCEEHIEVGVIRNRDAVTSALGQMYLDALWHIADDIASGYTGA